MPDRAPGTGPPPTDRMPTSPKVAAILLAALAALLLINAVLSFAGRETILATIAESARDRGESVDQAALSTQLSLSIARDAVLGVAAAGSVVLLARRRAAGRWLGIGCAVLLLALAVLTVIGVGGIPIYSLLLVVMTAAIVVMLLRSQTVDWLRADPVA